MSRNIVELFMRLVQLELATFELLRAWKTLFLQKVKFRSARVRRRLEENLDTFNYETSKFHVTRNFQHFYERT